MTTIPGTPFSRLQIYGHILNDHILNFAPISDIYLNQYGNKYYENKQYDKALGCYFLSAINGSENGQRSLGLIYHLGKGVPANYLSALKWYLKAHGNRHPIKTTPIGELFEFGLGVPVDKYKALEWYCHCGEKVDSNRLKNQGFHWSGTDKNKPIAQLIKETEIILETEMMKLEKKQNRTQEEIETLEQLSITYKIANGGRDAWEHMAELMPEYNATKSLVEPTVDYEDEIRRLTSQIEILGRENSSQITEKDNKIKSLKSEKMTLEGNNKCAMVEIQRLESSNAILEKALKSKDDTIMSLTEENSEMIKTLKSLLMSKDKELDLLKQNMANEQRRNDAAHNQNTTNSKSDIDDDPLNDINYDTDSTEESDINYDTPSENGDY